MSTGKYRVLLQLSLPQESHGDWQSLVDSQWPTPYGQGVSGVQGLVQQSSNSSYKPPRSDIKFFKHKKLL